MTRIILIIFIALGFFTSCKPKPEQPNIILIYVDDMGLGDATFTSGEVRPTPNIDRMASEGKVFTQYYTNAPVCSPSRVAITTGMYPQRWNINTFLAGKKHNELCSQSDYLKSNAPSLARSLKAAGYSTAHFGKWHMGGGRDVDAAPAITQYGFDEYCSTWESPDPDPLLTSINWIWDQKDSIKRWDRTSYFIDKTLDFLKRNKDKPCYINLWPDDVHSPWLASEQYDVGHRRNPLYYTLEFLQPVIDVFDRDMGRLMDGLKDLGLDENTLIIFTSDNGPAPTFGYSRTNGLRGSKNSLYEGGINMPFFVRWPDQIKPGQTDSESVISAVDLFPTLCRIAEADVPENVVLDGEDISKSFISEKETVDARKIFWEYGRRNPRFSFPDSLDKSPVLAVRYHDWKCFTSFDGMKVELYNLKHDPKEQKNVAKENEELSNSLKNEMLEWFDKTDKSELKPNIVFILADDCTHWDIACYGSKDAITPNIDKLAAEGMLFERCYQAAPMCSPTRHNIFTGLYPVKTGAYPNHTRANAGTESMVHYLKPLGYRVALSGKTHIAPKTVFPFEYLSQTKNPDFDKVETFLNDVQTSQEPFVLVLCSNEPHSPWDKGDASQFDPDEIMLPPNYVDTKETREAFCKYLAEINYLDGQVGEALGLLEKYGFSENTLVIFTSEQGNAFPFAKWTLYEAGVSSALIARMPGLIPEGSRSDAIVEYCDLLPTFIDVAGGEIPELLDGKSLVPLFADGRGKVKDYSYSIQTTRGIIAGSEYFGIRAVVGNNYRYIWNLSPEMEFTNATNTIRNEHSRYYQSWIDKAKSDERAKELVYKYSHRPKEELYDVKKDKWCENNLAEKPEFAKIKKELRKELLRWMKECGDKGQETELAAFEHMPGKKNP